MKQGGIRGAAVKKERRKTGKGEKGGKSEGRG